jgi:hypothetical protein
MDIQNLHHTWGVEGKFMVYRYKELNAQRLQQSSHVILLMAFWSLVVPFKSFKLF